MREPKAFWGRFDQSSILVLKGQVRYAAARALRSFFDEILALDKSDTIVIDLREIEGIDSTGMGLLAYLGRTTLKHGRRAVIVCAVRDVLTCLRSASFDTLFMLVDEWPYDVEIPLAEVSLENQNPPPEAMGQLMLEAHRNLSALSMKNRQVFAGVISELEADLQRHNPS